MQGGGGEGPPALAEGPPPERVLEEHQEAKVVEIMAQQAARMLPKPRSAKHKEALRRASAMAPTDPMTAALQAPMPVSETGSKLPHKPRQLLAAEKAPQYERLKDARQNGRMVAKFGSALLSITVAMLVVGLFLSDLPVTAAADPYTAQRPERTH